MTEVLPLAATGATNSARPRPRARKNKVDVQVVKVPGVNHLFVLATTGEVSEYPSLGPDAKVSAAMTTAIADWMKKTLIK